jgi:hypothetical protein
MFIIHVLNKKPKQLFFFSTGWEKPTFLAQFLALVFLNYHVASQKSKARKVTSGLNYF